MSNWQKMDHAPKDVPILVVEDGEIYIVEHQNGYLIDRESWVVQHSYDSEWMEDKVLYHPEFWMPLPALPDKEELSSDGYCTWTFNSYSGYYCEDDHWNTSCGQSYVMIEGTPRENDYKFCPACGKELVEVVIPFDEGEDGK